MFTQVIQDKVIKPSESVLENTPNQKAKASQNKT